MKEALFRAWSHTIHGLADSTISARISNCKWIEANVGDLDVAFDCDRCVSMLAMLSRDDGNSYQLVRLINGDANTNLATYRSSVNLYSKFRTWLLHNPVEGLLNGSSMGNGEPAAPLSETSSGCSTHMLQQNAVQAGNGEIAALWRAYSEALNALVGALGRSSNALGEISELLVARVHDGALLPASSKSSDVILQDGTRVQVKSRMLRQGTATSLGIIRSWDFDLLAILLFNPDGSLHFAGEIEAGEAHTLAKLNERQNGWVITTTNDVYHNPAMHDLTNQYREALDVL